MSSLGGAGERLHRKPSLSDKFVGNLELEDSLCVQLNHLCSEHSLSSQCYCTLTVRGPHKRGCIIVVVGVKEVRWGRSSSPLINKDKLFEKSWQITFVTPALVQCLSVDITKSHAAFRTPFTKI